MQKSVIAGYGFSLDMTLRDLPARRKTTGFTMGCGSGLFRAAPLSVFAAALFAHILILILNSASIMWDSKKLYQLMESAMLRR